MDGNFGLKKTKKGDQPSAYQVKEMSQRYFSADEKVSQYAETVREEAFLIQFAIKHAYNQTGICQRGWRLLRSI